MKPRMPRVELPVPYAVSIICDSIGPSGVRFTTFVVTYPRFVHSEMMTHRMLSKSSASSRAIPSEKMRAMIRDTPALPLWWGKNQSGMQAKEELDNSHLVYGTAQQEGPVDAQGGSVCRLIEERTERGEAQRLWLEARDAMLDYSDRLAKLGLHKALVNRLTEVWMPITVVISGTDWNNLWHLRDHPDAMPELQVPVTEMFYQYLESKPKKLDEGDWHQPFMDAETIAACRLSWNLDQAIPVSAYPFAVDSLNKISAARCARVSYLNHEGKRVIDDDLKLYDRLVRRDDPREPIHAAALEHTAQALATAERIGNVRGWRQLRKTIPNEAGPEETV